VLPITNQTAESSQSSSGLRTSSHSRRSFYIHTKTHSFLRRCALFLLQFCHAWSYSCSRRRPGAYQTSTLEPLVLLREFWLREYHDYFLKQQVQGYTVVEETLRWIDGDRTIVSETLKHFVGGFRPHYIEVCQPDLTLLTSINSSPNTIWWMGPVACNGNPQDILQALWGFPSGHSATSFASAVFLALYLNSKLKPFSDFTPGVLDLVTVLAPLLLASLISGSQYVTHVRLFIS
jgi:membrane-associated phospholipid phosphatase